MVAQSAILWGGGGTILGKGSRRQQQPNQLSGRGEEGAPWSATWAQEEAKHFPSDFLLPGGCQEVRGQREANTEHCAKCFSPCLGISLPLVPSSQPGTAKANKELLQFTPWSTFAEKILTSSCCVWAPDGYLKQRDAGDSKTLGFNIHPPSGLLGCAFYPFLGRLLCMGVCLAKWI